MRTTATARANIALVKYWGKREGSLNLPARGSLSITLDALSTRTTIELDPGASEDTLSLDGEVQTGKARTRVSNFLDLVRNRVDSTVHARVESKNHFPTAAGLASSASGFAALAVAAANAYGLELSPRESSILARRGSGSAARSIFGGFVRMHEGKKEDGSDAYAEPLQASLQLAAAIAVAGKHPKEVGSTEGMLHTTRTSPYHSRWLEQVDEDLRNIERALARGDFEQVAAVTEGSCLAMHADAMAARPGVIYFGPSTLWAIARVRRLRDQEGVPVFFTIDAGPHVVAFTEPTSLERVAAALREGPVAEVYTSGMGGPAAVEAAQ